MHNKPWLQGIVTGVCIASLLMPPRIQAAEKPGPLVGVRDVALDQDGSLRGSVLTADGKPQPHVDIALRNGKEIVGKAKTDADGGFTIRQVRPGVYELAAARSVNLYRVWTARTAPPAARSMALLVEESMVVRGQEHWSPVRRAVILGSVIITSGVVGGVIGYNLKDDDAS